jgi:flagellar biosynthesis protein FlhF
VPPETFTGTDPSSLFAQARAALGPDAVMLGVRRLGPRRFELTAAVADASAPLSAPAPRPARRALAPALTSLTPRRPGGPGRITGEPVVIALVGPTGAGKTTTVAKLANHPEVFGGWSAGLISLDTYRVGAIEQSRIYAELSGLPLEVAYEEAEVDVARARLARCEVVLVDTAGRSPRRRDDLAATRRALERLAPVEVHLVLPAGLLASHARRMLEEYRPLGVTHVLATKVDECPDDRNVFTLAADQGLPMRWATTGQEVPNDLVAAAEAERAMLEGAVS